MGRSDIAAFLVDAGARLDLFAAATLGRLDVIRVTVAAFPAIHRTPGPHGISLIRYARNAQKDEVVRFLEALE
jgi:hypothetical protein